MVAMILALMLLLTSCQTSPKSENQNLANELYWPVFPDPVLNEQSVVTYDKEQTTVKMPLWYWLLVVEYVVDVEANIEMLTGFP